MFKLVNKRLRNRKGFTLIELIVVIAILGILAAIALPRLGGFQDNARVAADEAYAKTLASSVDMYNAANNTTLTAGAISDLTDELEDMVEITTFQSTTYNGGVPTLAYNAAGNAYITNGTVTVWEP